jgi:uncharacterized delta-60 repeat protein
MKIRPGMWSLAVALALGGLAVFFWPRATPTLAPEVAVALPVAEPPAPSAGSIQSRAVSEAGATGPATVIAAGWAKESPAVFAAFHDWTTRYLAAPPAERERLLAEGVELARERRAALAQLIRRDPRAALAAAVPMVVRQKLPAAVVAQLEDRVSGRGAVALNAVTPAPGQTVDQLLFRSALIGRDEYTAYVYGRRDTPATVGATSIVGIAVDRALAVSESPLRVVEAGEVAAGRPLDQVCAISGDTTPVAADTALNLAGAPTAVEYNGKIQVLCHSEHVSALEKRLLAGEVIHIQTAADSGAGSSGVLYRPTYAWSHGTKKVLIIRVDFSDLQGTPVNPSGSVSITPDVAVNTFNNAGGVHDYYSESSYGQSTLQISPVVSGASPDVTPVLRLPGTAASYATAYNNDLLHSDARAAALALGYDEANYDRVGVVFSYLGGIASSQINYGGLGEVIGKYFWINGYYDQRVISHEIGHNYGLNHANLWQVADGNPISSSGTSTEYGDVFDPMGATYTANSDFSHWNKSILQWIPDTAVTLAASAGTYRIYRFDRAAAANLANPRALKVVRDSTKDYWIGYRHGSTNASLNGGAYVIWGYNTNQQGNLLDMTTPGTNPSGTHDEGLAIGTTFSDTVAGITIKPLAQGGTGTEEWLDVQIGFQPKAQWSQTTFLADEQGGSAVLTLKRSQNNTGVLSVNYATANGTATAPANYTTQSGTVTWLDGDMADKTISIPLIASSLTAGTSASFTVTLSGVTGGVLGESPAATVTMVAPGVRDVSFDADFINNTVTRALPLPDGSVVLAGWFGSVQDGGFNNYTRSGVTKVGATGLIDPTFAAGGGANTVPVYDLARQPDGKVIAVGNFTTFNGTASNRIVRLLSDGSSDPAFNPGTGADGTIYAVLVQPDGKIVIGGGFTIYNGTAREYLARLNPDGSLDTGFVGPDFASTSGWRVESLALQPDGKLLVGGQFYFSGSPFKAGICRVLTTGALDSTFNGITNGAHASTGTGTLKHVYRIVVQPDGKILIGGDFSAFNGTANLFGGLARLTTTGVLDGTFTPPTSSDGGVKAMLLQPDGKIVVGGTFTTFGSAASRLARFSGAGAFDAAFSAPGGHGLTVEDLELQPDGRVVLSGNYAVFQGSSSGGPLWRFFSGLSGRPGTIQFSSAGYAGNNGTTITVNVSRSGGSLGALTVGYSTVSGTATTADYTPASGVLTWADGDTATKTVNLTLLADASAPASETFTLNLGQPLIGGALLGAQQQASIQINYLAPGFPTWQAGKFTPAELLDANVSGPNAVYGLDGLPNLIKYALGLEPKTNITTGLPVVTTTASDWVYTYTRPASATDLTYSVEVSTNLTTWTSVGVTHEFVSSSGAGDTWRGRYPLASAANLYFRLKIVR